MSFCSVLLWCNLSLRVLLVVQGMAAGHAYYFLEDVYPVMTGRRILKTPGIIKALFPEDNVVVPTRPANGWGAPGVVAEAQPLHRD